MRGNVLAALSAAALIALFSYWRLSDDGGDSLVDVEAMPGTWVRSASESCNPALPAKLRIDPDGHFVAANSGGVWRKDEHGRYTLLPDTDEFPNRVFRANSERLELLNQLGCKATYARAQQPP